jgi:hypothetical protein
MELRITQALTEKGLLEKLGWEIDLDNIKHRFFMAKTMLGT